jgi:hypothetical protein
MSETLGEDATSGSMVRTGMRAAFGIGPDRDFYTAPAARAAIAIYPDELRECAHERPWKSISVGNLDQHSRRQPRKGRDSIAQGAEPWEINRNTALALKGRDSDGEVTVASTRNLAPMGLSISAGRQPRADAPWADESRPGAADPATSPPIFLEFFEQIRGGGSLID